MQVENMTADIKMSKIVFESNNICKWISILKVYFEGNIAKENC